MGVSVVESADKEQVLLKVTGRFDFSSHHEFSSAYKQYPKGERRFVVDLSDTEYMDSSSMGMLLQLKEHACGQMPVSLVNANDAVREILQIANFDKLFSIA
ncbi:STAS domain-containing protein [Sedimenticola sp.]|uniref:STAS domain-containing protein n=1 Tax=Sedimenticola sp. TaxID=1940285 RepID=UPI003D10F445